ncbi:phage minor structural protein [Bacillus sp. RC242]|uniref:phage tail spike protein n=1 Tax=Bacillus sp. RC242 TaxID=3156286 RepID=UPI0038381881
MRTPSGVLHIIDFKTSQIVSAIQPKDYWDDKRHWKIKNNIDTLEFKVFDNTKHAATLMQQNLVLKEVRDGRIVPYVITEIEKNSDDRSVTAYASGEWIQLAKAGIIPPQKLEGKTVIEMVDIALAGTKWKKGDLEYASFHSMTIDEFIDPLSFLKKVASLFELEIQYRAEVVGSQVVGRYVDMVKKRGRETGKEVTLGKDLMGIKRIENSKNICTALLGFVKKEGGEFVTITEINNGLPYLVDSDAFQRWNEKGKHKFGFYTPETEEDITPKRLMTLMKTELAKRINTSYTYDVQAQSIGRVFGLAHELINEGDSIRIKDTGFTPKLYLEARTIAGDESYKNPLQDKYVFGDYREIVDPNEELRKIYNRILSSLGNKQEMIDQLDELVKKANETAGNAQKESEAAKTLAEKVQENLKNNTVEIIEAKNPPTTGLKPYKTLWRDISNGKPGILKIWTGTAWESVVPDVESVKKETLEQVNKDIESTKTELNKKVQEAQNQATGQVNEVKESLQGVSRTISDVQNKQGEIDKKVTKFEQDSNGFKQSIESLTKKDSEISNKLNTVESTVEGTKKTISEVQQATNTLKQTTTEIKEQVGKITEKLESVDKKTDTLNETFTRKTTDIEKSVEGVKSTVSTVQNNQTGFNQRITTVEQTASGLSSTVSGLNNVVSDQGKKLTEANTKLEQQATAIGAKVELKQVEDYVAGFKIPDLKNVVNQNKEDLLSELANKLATEQFNQEMTMIDNRFSVNEKGIDLAAKKTEVYTRTQADGEFAKDSYVRDMESRLELTEKGVSISVKENGVIAAFNMSKENITLNANKINLVGFITANHIKGQVLEGVTLKTTGDSEQRFIQINKQNIRLYDKNEIRGFLGFYDRSTDGGLQPTFILGRDSAQGSMNGSFALTQVTPRVNGVDDFDTSYATLGMVAYYNPTTNEFSRSSQITFYRDGGHMNISADGRLTLQSKNDVYIGTEGIAGTYGGRVYVNAASYAWIKASKEVYIESGNGNWTFSKTNKPSEQNAPGIKDDDMNADFRLAYVLMRSSHASGYQGSLQIKSVNGNEFRDLEARYIKAVSLQQTSTRKIKTAIKDIEINSLDKFMGLKVQQYYFKSDMDRLYEMRENRKEGDPLPTVKDIPLQYGFIAEDSDDVFTTVEKEAINLYPVVSLAIDATQNIYIELKEENKQLKQRVATLENDVSEMKALLQKLIS